MENRRNVPLVLSAYVKMDGGSGVLSTPFDFKGRHCAPPNSILVPVPLTVT